MTTMPPTPRARQHHTPSTSAPPAATTYAPTAPVPPRVPIRLDRRGRTAGGGWVPDARGHERRRLAERRLRDLRRADGGTTSDAAVPAGHGPVLAGGTLVAGRAVVAVVGMAVVASTIGVASRIAGCAGDTAATPTRGRATKTPGVLPVPAETH